MATATRPKQIDELMEKASQALAKTRYFEAESLAMDALAKAREIDDFDRLTRLLMPLQEARRQRYQQALDADEVTIIDDRELTPETWACEPGCYLVQPPLVGADARRLRLQALQKQVPVAILCREPTTMIRLCPVVAIAPGCTIRTRVDLPKDPEHPDLAWFVDTMEALGEEAIAMLDPGQAIFKRVDRLIAMLDAVPDHEGLHQTLEASCRTAERELAEST
jgi:hypothetical protein